MIYQTALRFFYIARQFYPEFLNAYKIFFVEKIPLIANHLRNVVLPANTQFRKTDDFTGLLSFPETDVSEFIVEGQLLTAYNLEEVGMDKFLAINKLVKEKCLVQQPATTLQYAI